MFRVTVEYFDSHITLKVEGQLEGSGVEALERYWQLIGCAAPTKPLRVELDGVTGIASEGRVLIGRLAAAGAEVVASVPIVKSIVDEIQEAQSATELAA